MFKSFLARASTVLIALLLPTDLFAQSPDEEMPLPRARPGFTTGAATPVPTPAPVNLGQTSPDSTVSFSGAMPTSLRALPKMKPGLPPLSSHADPVAAAIAATQTPAQPSTTAKPQAGTPMPAVSRTDNGIEPQRGSLKQALDALSKRKTETALAIHKGMKHSLDRVILTYILAIGGYPGLPASEIKAFYDRKTQWPSRSLLEKRIEEAVVREKPSGAPMVRAFGNHIPKSTKAAIELAISHAKVGNRKMAARIIAPVWRENILSRSLESKILRNLGQVLTNADHFYRASYLLYRERATAAYRLKKYLTAGQYKLVDARAAVARRKKDAGKKLNAVPKSLRKDPGYIFSRIQYLRRTGKSTAAADLMISAPRDINRLINHREWWIERRLLSRIMLNKGDAHRAYKIAATHTAQRTKDKSEAEFHAGFFALRYRKDAKTAAVHFERSWKVATRARDKSRGLYWQGRAWEAAGSRANAVKFYQAAANPTVYYGQLALEELGQTHLSLRHPPAAGSALKRQFNGRKLVRAVKRLKAVGHQRRSGPILRHLARTISDPSEIALAHQLAQSYGLHQEAVQIGQIAQSRGMPADKMAFPLNVIPRSAKTHGVDIAMIYALAKQESVFNIRAISSANARGLMQMLPATAKRTAKKIGVRYSKAKLTRDPKYVVNLGSAHLKSLIDKFGGSYIMTFAAYNAGAGRLPDWINRFGDPRTRRVSAIDWVERIPFTETRNYVMKLMENLQVYEARIHNRPLDISKDLKRGRP